MLLFQVKRLKNCQSFYQSYLDPVGNMVQLDRRTLTSLDQSDATETAHLMPKSGQVTQDCVNYSDLSRSNTIDNIKAAANVQIINTQLKTSTTSKGFYMTL